MKANNQVNKVLVFDLGGVLMDWSPYYLYCDTLGLNRQTVDAFLQEVNFTAWNRELDRGRSFQQAIDDLSAAFPAYADWIRAYDQRYQATVRGAFQPVVDLLERLKLAGYPLHALSNWSAEKFYTICPHYPFFQWFDSLLISGDVGLIKPDAAIFELLLQRIGRPAQDCIFIDDHLPNVLAARDLGFHAIQFLSPVQLEAELQALGVLNGVVLQA